ncbi:MAG: polysaccharide ABC transporter ATP-binding protein, partial [Bacteroidia bacterium]|nr:polysaccharide ABC transporter ATP-binding protein [Bacteroidia bacterium]
MSSVIQISNLSKIYRLGEIGTGGTISRDLERWYKMRIKGQEDPFLKIGETNDRSKKGVSDVVYSLRDINLEVQQGEALGIIGKNGAGKSTLLKILSRVTSPTTGKIHIKGRVASLLEVGTGFHPELTGRENIYLNGAILGMRKKEIIRKLDEIIDFSGVERYIDTPVKRYSSGMYVRLAFAVAAHLESEIMIVDEVLAVGDAEFQRKCLGKMGEVSKGEGRTVLFVSHNMQAIRNLCPNCLLLDRGQKILLDNTNIVLVKYNELSKAIKIDAKTGINYENNRRGEGAIRFTNIDVQDDQNNIRFNFNMGETIKFKLSYKVFDELDGLKVFIALRSGL